MVESLSEVLCEFLIAYFFPVVCITTGLWEATIPSLCYFLSFLLFFGLPSTRQHVVFGIHVIYPPHLLFFSVNAGLSAGFLLARCIIYYAKAADSNVAHLFGTDVDTSFGWMTFPDIMMMLASVVAIISFKTVLPKIKRCSSFSSRHATRSERDVNEEYQVCILPHA